ncbi:hypothetical protein [Roseburia inulinivorans]|uniref:hypothetical protein n=1 Tax=Roseburia inulinivorans TaxID=360807 RepID=UPI0002F14F4B|nr:hypothetical protein [Roseburia inulinivorans]
MNRQLTMLIVDDMEVERISFAEIFKDEYQILEAEKRETGDGTTGTTKGTYCSS